MDANRSFNDGRFMTFAYVPFHVEEVKGEDQRVKGGDKGGEKG